ncbi:MAG TPA: hypothetical protein VHB79_03065 [Polyangiaceae bacterium]|nr:hypothetical protein [Polyangiaceae bacterium]
MSDEAYALLEAAFASGDPLAEAARLAPEQRQALRSFWIARASGELTTALSFEFMLDDLRELQAPRVLLQLAERAVSEEHRHVDWCLRFARLLGEGEDARAELGGTSPLTFDGASDADNRVLRTVFGGCFSETVAVHVLRASQELLTEDATSRLNRQHLAEEIGHSRLGWGLLGWPGLGSQALALVAEYAPAMEALTRSLWLGPRRAHDHELEALGYLSRPLVTQALDQAFAEVIWPGLARCGVRV